jgi:hypothetical protein
MKNSISDLLITPWTTCVIFTAVRLKIFTILSNNKLTIKELSSACGTIPEYLKALLEACDSLGLIISKNDKYLNSHFSNIYLVEGKPFYVGDLIELQHNEAKQWNNLYELLIGSKRSNRDQSDTNNNCRLFIKAMNNLGMLGEAEALKKSVNLDGYKRLVDAGGGSGLYSVVLCREYPGLTSIIMDKSEVLAITKEMIKDFNEKKQITLRSADITKDSLGDNIDAVLLSDVIYSETFAMPIITNAFKCLRKGGLLIIRGYYSDPENSKPLFGALFVLNLLVFNPNTSIMTISSLKKKVCDTGFKVIKTSSLTERSMILIAEK